MTLQGCAKRSGKGKAAGHQPWTSVAGRSLAKVQVCSGSKAQSIPRPSACAALAGRSLPSLPDLSCSEHCLSHPKIVSRARSDLWLSLGVLYANLSVFIPRRNHSSSEAESAREKFKLPPACTDAPLASPAPFLYVLANHSCS